MSDMGAGSVDDAIANLFPDAEVFGSGQCQSGCESSDGDASAHSVDDTSSHFSDEDLDTQNSQ